MTHIHLIGLLLLSTGLAHPRTVKELFRLEGHDAVIYTVAFSPDGKCIATGGDDGTARLWDLAKGKELARFSAKRGVCALAFSPDGKLLAYSSVDGITRLVTLDSGKELHQLRGHDRYAKCLAFHPGGKLLATGGEDGAISLWELGSGKESARLTGHKSWVNSLAFTPDGGILASGSHDQTVILWRLDSAKSIRQLRAKDQVDSIALSPDGRTLAMSGYYDPEIQLWEAATGKKRGRFPGGMLTASLCVAFSPDGKTLICGSLDNAIHFWDVKSAKEFYRLEGHSVFVRAVAFSPSGSVIASAGSDKTLRVWDVSGLLDRRQSTAIIVTNKELEKLWSDLEGNDAVNAYRASCLFTSTPEQAVAFLRIRLKSKHHGDMDKKRIAQLVVDLDSDEFSVRRKAASELKELAEEWEPALRAELKGALSVEARRKLEGILQELDDQGIVKPGNIQLLRSIELLEHIGNPDARKVLESLATGNPLATSTQQAKASLQRLTRQKVKP